MAGRAGELGRGIGELDLDRCGRGIGELDLDRCGREKVTWEPSLIGVSEHSLRIRIRVSEVYTLFLSKITGRSSFSLASARCSTK